MACYFCGETKESWSAWICRAETKSGLNGLTAHSLVRRFASRTAFIVYRKQVKLLFCRLDENSGNWDELRWEMIVIQPRPWPTATCTCEHFGMCLHSRPIRSGCFKTGSDPLESFPSSNNSNQPQGARPGLLRSLTGASAQRLMNTARSRWFNTAPGIRCWESNLRRNNGKSRHLSMTIQESLM